MMLSMRILSLSLLGVLTACASTVQQPPRDLAGDTAIEQRLPTAELARYTDGRIRSDLGYLESVQGRIKALNDKGEPAAGAAMAQAQCWLEWALDEYHDNDRTGVIEEAAGEAVKIVAALESGARPDLVTRIVATSTRVREDLWARAAAVRARDEFAAPRRCANEAAMCLEVRLVEAGHDLRETGWRHARAAIIEAEQLAARAEREIASCPALPAPAAAPVVVPADGDDDRDGVPNSIDRCPNTPPPARVDAWGCEFTTELRLPGVNFETASATLLEESFAVLDGAVATLRRYPELRIEVAGHTDSRGTDAYNRELSQRRAEAVRSWLVERGVGSALTARGYGESQPISSNATEAGRRDNRRVTLRIIP
jgi:outer membrane protein OmpA-like peptidoglycan-associated protein